MNNGFLRLVVVSACTIGAVKILNTLLSNSDERDGYLPEKETLLLQVFNSSHIFDWYDRHKDKVDADSILVVSTVTDKTMRLFTFSQMSPELVPDKHILLSIVDKSLCRPKIYCLVNFESLDESIIDMIGNEEYIILQE